MSSVNFYIDHAVVFVAADAIVAAAEVGNVNAVVAVVAVAVATAAVIVATSDVDNVNAVVMADELALGRLRGY